MNASVIRLFWLAVVGVGVGVDSASAQETVVEILEEIEVVPEGHIGTWRVGGVSYIATDETTFDLDHAAEIGRLAEVEYVVREGVNVALDIEPQAFGPEHVSDGPHVFWRDDGAVEIVSICGGIPRRVVHRGITTSTDVPSPCADGSKITLDPRPPVAPGATWPQPERLLAVSDLEGNAQALRWFLRKNGVVDADGHWAWGTGHLVFNGDIVDRGHQVTEILWDIRRLEREAAAAGGRVHFVLGNHEAMIMAGDLRYIHVKYRFVTGRLGLTYDQLYGPTSDMGRWLRTRPALLRIGNLLFVHAGYAPDFDALGLTIDEVNTSLRASLGTRPARGTLRDTFSWHSMGPLWYRGYFVRHADDWGGRPTPEQIGQILERHDVDHIVVGHTVVDDIGWLNPERQLIAIDVHWASRGEGEGLLVDGESISRVTMSGDSLPLVMVQDEPVE